MKHEIGTNAGIIWQTITARNGRVSFEELLNATGLQSLKLYSRSAGWSERTKCHCMAKTEL